MVRCDYLGNLWKYCLCLVIVQVYGKLNQGKRDRSVSGFDLLENIAYSTNNHQTERLGTAKGWRFNDEDSGEVTFINLKKSLKKSARELTLDVIGYSDKRTLTSLFGIYLKYKPLPLFEISLDIHRRKVILRYQGDKSFQRLTLTFGKELEKWTVLSATLNETHCTVKVGCSVEKTVPLPQKLKKIPKRAVGVLGSGKNGKNKFMGQLFEARFLPYAAEKQELLCFQPVNVASLLEGAEYQNDGAVNGDRILLLEQQITQLNNMVNMLKLQNGNLTSRVAELESCDCATECQWEGQVFDEGQTWNPDKCTVCICRNEKSDCLQRTDISSCQTPCVSNPCQNKGQCVSFDEVTGDDFQCMCQPPYDGQFCEFKENPCVWPQEPGICDQEIPRFYYDMELQECLPFNYTGCGGNVNNYETLDECRAVAVQGSCCYRQYSLKVKDVIDSAQREKFGCKYMTLNECQSTHRQVMGDTEMEVISFYPGVKCEAAQCGHTEAVCMIDDQKFEVGDKAVLGCQECTCESSGQFVCSCSKKAVRKEIRDMTSQELAQFQAAIQQLRLVGPGNPWEEFRDIYMRHTMHSNGGPYFLPWHRIFLRKLEQKLQQIDCSITLPYYDFSTDVGNFEDAVIWQPNYFGGNGVKGCVPDHPFGLPGSWRPCINRKFNADVNLPTLIELSLAMASEDYTEMSMCLEAYVSYIHTYIGGDMASRAAAYDPIFYSVHAYIDMLYWWWQSKGNNKFKYPAAFGNIPMVPFNVPPSAIHDLEADLCVQYMPPSKGHPCNRTLEVDTTDDGRPMRGDITPEGDSSFEGGFNSLGYNTEGYDRRGYNSKGYNNYGFNRDGYNLKGYDRQGYNRYGYDSDNYNRHGYDIEGWSKDNMQDLTGRYNAYGFDMNCRDRRGLDKDGLDKYGFDMKGYDFDRCNYFYNGPFATIQSQKIWEILLVQPKSFLMTLARTCPGLEPLPSNWLQQYWITVIKDVTENVPVQTLSYSRVKNSARFCFDIDMFVSSCGCDVGIATCVENPCQTTTCPSYPEASCRVDFCGACKPRWYFNGEEVDCYEERDFCLPNPCENGGTCVASVWPSEPQLTSCYCPPGFDGHYCQYSALDVCTLPVSAGQCTKQQSRWYFDPQTQTCKSFLYSGCAGNSNNFLSRGACESRCKIGACCYRFPENDDISVGYDFQGYDIYGFDVSGKNRRGDVRIEDNGIKTGRDRFPSRYDWQGYDRNGYDMEGYDRWGLDKSGYNKEGFNMTGYNAEGEYDGIIDYNPAGYDEEGYNRAGFSCQGNNREGLNAYKVFAEFTYKCRSATLEQCQRIETQAGNRIVKFTPGRRCEEVRCSDSCGCWYNDKTYKFGETFMAGCQFCTCTLTGSVECTCPKIYRRKDIRDMTLSELQKYQEAVKKLNKMEFPSTWYNFAQIYANHKPQAMGNSASLPWHRQYLRMVERELQKSDCSITIPYYDWTVNAGNQHKSRVWAANMFGGNGQGINGCVEFHPFKDYYPPFWVPCLRRNFNSSIPLPDVVDIQYALNESTYERFRLSMEVYMDIFKSWVGGHMDSDNSPYDPMFLSVVAFIDRLWWDWENKHENGLLLYPQELRYVPMMPFRTTPDDVMDSKKQLCVTYFPLTEGALCNITLPNLNYNSLGYDRHGFDREGYDIEGYNVYGRDKDGKLDDRGIYNQDGFDREGFQRNGYDSMGFDRFGFSADNYNIDGYDSAGFDRSGYDRYGFNRSGITPFGFHRNGTLVVDTVPNIFDDYGYNRYGLNRYGFDREGYDVFGYDTMGYDRRKCNRNYLGPMLVIIKRWAEVELSRLEDKSIRVITRICPAISSLPKWRYTLNWLKRGDQVPLIEGIVGRAQERARALNTKPRTNSVTDDNIWLPVGPDKSLCFVTYYYTECPFGEFPVSCAQDLCLGRKCPGYPDAICRVNNCGKCEFEWYNGVTGNVIECSGCIDRQDIERGEGTSWPESECESCSCRGGLVTCSETICDPVTCTHAVKIPGKCCLQCDVGCNYEGMMYESGQQFRSPSVQCEDCSCIDGSVSCFPRLCPDLNPCQSQVILEGECCPTCMDCDNRASGDTWKETPCQQCTCVGGEVECEKILCIPPDCSHPQIPKGECCPVCDGCTIQSRELQNDQKYMPDKCNECVCHYGNLECDLIPCPIAPCLNPIMVPGDCCPTCDNECVYGSRRYRHGESFISREDQCTNCTCDNSLVTCMPVTCPRMNLPCRRPLTLPGNCCPSQCPTCSADGRVYKTGETWKSLNDPCETCECEEGVITCRIETCRRRQTECQHGVVKRGQCCSECTDCVFDGQFVRNGQIFVRPGDNCQQCTCLDGHVTCQSLGPCPRLQCRVTETPPGACCPQCKRCESGGRMFSHGDVVSSDQCSTCYCREGEISCERVACPELKCRSPRDVPGQCCPVCDDCDYKGKTYDDGKRFTPLREPCLDCQCQSGEVSCSSRENECPISRCTHPIKSLRKCCPTCNGCSYLRRRFRNGQKFVPPGQDNCKVCRCVAGSIECNRMGCPAVHCDNAVLVKGQCCPVCPLGCNVMGIEYRDGQTFIDFMNRCHVCTCMMGQIRCMQMMSCPRVTCTHPANRAGNCCPSCTMCEQNNVQHRNGAVFTDPADPCQECTCRDGSITCRAKSVSCPRPNCADPVIDPDTCCPMCEPRACMYAGRQYGDGQEVPASRDRCEMCQCSQGLIDCGRKQCPVVNCRHPGRDECCDTCEYCDYNGMRFELGEIFPSSYEECEDCVCQAGSVECLRKQCDIPNCSFPVYIAGVCCPVCSDCTYQALLFKDGENFENPSNPCETCHCMKGNVACDTRQCPKISCRFPVTDGCCPRCSSDCQYQNVMYRNQEVISRTDETCSRCMCVDGDIKCGRQECTHVSCDHPVTSGCCPECTDCQYQNHLVRNGQSFQDTSDDCNQCSCHNGTVSCNPLPCQPANCANPTRGKCCLECRTTECNYLGRVVRDGEIVAGTFDACEECRCIMGNLQCYSKECPTTSCSHPIKMECCKECDGCSFNGRDYPSGLKFTNPQDSCQNCKCSNGNVDCRPVDCPPIRCKKPVQDGCCRVCPQCMYYNHTYRNGERFPDETDVCNECTCHEGDVQCNKRQCPTSSCSRPIRKQCCYECTDCTYHNRNYRNGQRFTDECKDCVCSGGNVQCNPRICAPVTCDNPVTIGCCPVCAGGCRFEDRQLRNGEAAPSARDPCNQCTCQDGRIRCERERCPQLTCSHPTQGTCCPECDDCQIGMEQVRNGEEFKGNNDICTACTCQSGTIVCQKRYCTPVSCTDPVMDRCGCPVCGQNCRYGNQAVRHGQRFEDPADKCKECLCETGSVTCTRKPCLELTCLQKVTRPGQCCPVCQDCTYNDVEYRDGARWTLRDNPCITCTCTGGFVTCMEMQCLTPCTNSVTIPGQCCSVCPTCRFDGTEYGDGERFSPSGDPCDTCTCRDGKLQCYHDTCSGMSDCPVEQQRDPQPGTCCPTCSGLSTDCTRARFGEVTYPRSDDPCFYCECQSSFDWVCSREDCPQLPCHPSVQLTTPGECCPSCPACYDASTRQYHREGTEWKHPRNVCFICKCQLGSVVCRDTVCEPSVCDFSERLVTVSGECCPSCEIITTTGCLYEGSSKQSGEEWRPDDCTTCQCVDGEVMCVSDSCLTPQCGPNDSPTVLPGTCCPLCLPNPGTCLVYGDPHYKTFDGSTLHFQGTCKYVMATDCDTQDFMVEVQHDDRGVTGVSWAQNFTIMTRGVRIDLLQNHRVLVNNALVRLPYTLGSDISVERRDNNVLVNTRAGIKFVWNGASSGELSVPGNYKRKMCGLCGNFNGFPQDDMRMKSGQITQSPAVFGNSWKAADQKSGTCSDASDADPCVQAGYMVRKRAAATCEIIRSPSFSACHRVVAMDSYYASCVYDLCACEEESVCLCDILTSYAKECAKAGVRLQWRSQSLCAIDCDTNNGFLFDDCGPVCQRTCDNWQTPLGDLSQNCYKPCVASCQCSADKVVHDGKCIRPQDCPKNK